MMQELKKVDVVVVGSGISGMTAASLLAKHGKKVALVEKQKKYGGALRQFKRGGFSYDVGFHYTGGLGQGEILRSLWGYLGVLPEIPCFPFSPDGYDRFEFPERQGFIHGYFSYLQLEEELAENFPSEKENIKQYFKTIQSICSEVPFYNYDKPLRPFLRGYKSRPQSLNDYLATLVSDKYLRSVLAAPTFLYGVPLTQASLEVHALVAHGYYSGAWGVVGGGQSVVDAFVSKLKESGVELISDEAVDEITVDGQGVTGVNLVEHGHVSCKHVVFSGHPSSIVDIAPPSVFRPAYRKRLQGLKNSLSMFAVFGRSEKNLDTQQGAVNYYVLPQSGEVLTSDSTTPYEVRPMMLTSTRNYPHTDLQLEANGIILLRSGYWEDVAEFAQSTSGTRCDDYNALKERVTSEMIASAENRWGEYCGKIEPLAVGSPLTFRDELNAPKGCAYGAMHCLDQFNPDVRTRLPGLYLCGQSTLMTGVAGSSISGLISAGEILGLDLLWKEMIQWG